MKKIIIILLFTFCWDCGYSQGDSIPELNKRVLRVCDSLLGQKIGKGRCSDFVNYVARKINFKYVKVVGKIKKSYTHEFNILPGDILFIKRTKLVYLGKTHRFPGHVAIIHHKLDNYNFVIIHQYKGVNICTENFPIGGMYRGKIEIHRPDE